MPMIWDTHSAYCGNGGGGQEVWSPDPAALLLAYKEEYFSRNYLKLFLQSSGLNIQSEVCLNLLSSWQYYKIS